LPDIPFMVTIYSLTSPTSRGQCYVQVSLRFAGYVVGQLIAGYISDSAPGLRWPDGKIEWSTEGPGLLVLNVDETLNDSDKTISIPTNVRWRPISLWCEYAATATAGSRNLRSILRDDVDDHIGALHSSLSIGASQSARIMIGEGAAYVNPAADFEGESVRRTGTFPRGSLPQGYDIRIYDALAIDPTADDLIIQFLVEEWIEE